MDISFDVHVICFTSAMIDLLDYTNPILIDHK